MNPEYSQADHSVPGVLWGKVCALLFPLLPAAAEGKGPWGSQLAGADSRLQFVGEGSEDLVELLIAAGLAAAGTLAAPEEAHLELSAEHLEELRPGLETCRVGHRGQGTTIQLGKLGLLPGATTSRGAPFQGTSPHVCQGSHKVCG